MNAILAILLTASTMIADEEPETVGVTGLDEFKWQEVIKASTGEIYMIAFDEISDVEYLGVPMKKTVMLIDNFQGKLRANRQWSNIFVMCEEGTFNVERSVTYKFGSSEGVATINNDQVSFTNADTGTPMSAVIQKVCAAP